MFITSYIILPQCWPRPVASFSLYLDRDTAACSLALHGSIRFLPKMEPCVVIYLFSATHGILFDQWSMFLLPINNAVRNMTIVGTIDRLQLC